MKNQIFFRLLLGMLSFFGFVNAQNTNLALNRATEVSSSQSENPKENVNDGITSTRWSSEFTPEAWIYIDLGSVRNVNKVILRWENAYGKAYRIETSTNISGNNPWTIQQVIANGNGDIDEISFNAVNARYVRMFGTERANVNWGYSLYEFEVYGSLCASDVITPYIQINGGAWQQTASASVSPGNNVIFGPQPLDNNWSWKQLDGSTISTREISINNVQANNAGDYEATYTNSCGAQTKQTFSLSVAASAYSFYTIKSAWKGDNAYLFDQDGNWVGYGPLTSEDKFYWVIIDLGNGYKRIMNKATGNFMNTLAGDWRVQCYNVAPGDLANHWVVKPETSGNGNMIIQNRSTGKYLNIEDEDGAAHCNFDAEPKEDDLWSGQWIFTPVSGTIVPVTGVSVNTSSVNLTGYVTHQLSVTVTPGNATFKKLWLSSSNPGVATSSFEGLVSAGKTGTTTLTVIPQTGSGSATVNVTVSPVNTTGVSITSASTEIFKGKSKKLIAVVAPDNATNKLITWRSNNTNIARVNMHGVVTGVNAGTTSIEAVNQSGQKATSTVIVRNGGNATPVLTFLNSIGANTAINVRGENLEQTIKCVDYLGLRFVRHEGGDYGAANALFSRSKVKTKVDYLVGNSQDINTVVNNALQMANHGSLLAIEGPNEPNTWTVTYQGQKGGDFLSWLPVVKYQRDLYKVLKSNSVLRKYPVFMHTDNGAETDNAGAQFIHIPGGSNILSPDGSQFADYANMHNYFSHDTYGTLVDNITWRAASANKEPNNLFENYGVTWKKGFTGYAGDNLTSLPKVTTETGITLDKWGIDQSMHGRLLLNCYLSQFKQGYSYTAVYLLRDREDEGGNQDFGFYDRFYNKRLAADYLHNLTTILNDSAVIAPGSLNYTISNGSSLVHDLLLQKSNGNFVLIVWGERYASSGSDNITINLGSVFASVNVYDPTRSPEPIETLNDVSFIEKPITNHPYLFEISAAGLRSSSMVTEDADLIDLKPVMDVVYLKDNSIWIAVNAENKYIVQVTNVKGMVVKTFEGSMPAVYTFRRGELPAGVYIINFNGNGKSEYKKIVLQ